MNSFVKDLKRSNTKRNDFTEIRDGTSKGIPQFRLLIDTFEVS